VHCVKLYIVINSDNIFLKKNIKLIIGVFGNPFGMMTSDAGWSESDTLFLRGDISMYAGSSCCWY
jgi:hypothetical protein